MTIWKAHRPFFLSFFDVDGSTLKIDLPRQLGSDREREGDLGVTPKNT
jgi:hypothetical protein